MHTLTQVCMPAEAALEVVPIAVRIHLAHIVAVVVGMRGSEA